MAKGSNRSRVIAFRKLKPTPRSFTACNRDGSEDSYPKRCSKPLDKKGWKDATCPVCLECPHNAVLLLCSSHDGGCRPYMCGTSFRYSNCFDQYKKFHTKVVLSNEEEPLPSSIDDPVIPVLAPSSGRPVKKCEVTRPACPHCRGLVKGWTVVEPARECLNAKQRICMQDGCTFVGTFKELRKHMRSDHPCARPREVDPTLEQNWRRIVRERDEGDVSSIIDSAIQGAMVSRDYVIEGNHHGSGTDEDGAAVRSGGFEARLDSIIRQLEESSRILGRQARQLTHAADENAFGFLLQHTSPLGLSEQDGDNIALVSRRRRRRHCRSGTRRRQREACHRSN